MNLPIHNRHQEEWLNSGIDPDIIALNLQSIADLEVNPITREVSAPIAELLNQRYVRFGQQIKESQSGWWVSGIDPLNNWEPMSWGRFKPDQMWRYPDGKTAKYVSPKNEPSRVTLLLVPTHIWQRVSALCGISTAGYDLSNPAEFWRWVFEQHVPITLIEGEKKAASLLTLGIAAIALPGFRGAARSRDKEGFQIPPVLIPDVEFFATPGREITILFDFETKLKTKQGIEAETRKLDRLLRARLCAVKVARLPGPEKGADDFVMVHGAEAFLEIYRQRRSLRDWDLAAYSVLSFPPSAQLNQRYLGDLDIPSDARLVAIKSAKGTGKTESYKAIVEGAAAEGRRVLFVTHRVQLGQNICDRVGLPYVSELRTSEEGSLLGYGVCVDSLHPNSQARFNASGWKGAIVIFDEAEQVIWHLLSATTEVRNHRIEVLQQLKELLTLVLEGDGRVFVSDADLTDLSIQFIQDLVGRKIQPHLIVNNWQPQDDHSWLVHHYAQGQPDQWFAGLVAEMQGGRPFVITHSQKAKSRWSTVTLEGTLAKLYPDKKILRIDSESIANPSHPAYGCISALNEILLQYDAVICSPSIETGVSIDIRGHFTSVWGCFQGVSPDNSARQSLARVREPVSRHLWIAKYGIGRIESGATNHRALLMSQRQLAWANLSLLEAAAEQDLDAINCSIAGLQTWAKFAARINAGMVSYRETVLSGLESEGHLILETDPANPAAAELKATVLEVREEQYQAQREAIADAEEITSKQYETLKSQKSKKPEEWQKERKHKLQQRYCIPVTADLVAKDDDGWHPRIRLHYYLSVGRDYLRDRDRAASEIELRDGKAWLPSFNHSQLGAKVAILDSLGISRLFDPDKLWNKRSAVVKEIAAKAQKFSRAIQDGLGVSVSSKPGAKPMTPIQVVQILLGRLGLRLSYIGRMEVYPQSDQFGLAEDAEAGRERCYRFVDLDDGRAEVYQAWLERDQAVVASTPSKKETYTAEGVAA